MADVGAQAVLHISGPHVDAQRPVAVGGELVVIGSGMSCEVRLPAAPGIAEEHASISSENGRHLLSHLARGHVTEVGGKPVFHGFLDDGDEIEIGPYRLRYRVVPSTAVVEPASPEPR